MPWKEVSVMEVREEFVTLASKEGANVRQLCRRFGISPTTGYKWLSRHAQEGRAGLADQSRRPTHSPRRTAEAIEQAIVTLRKEHPHWGARKLCRVLQRQECAGSPPAVSTVHAVLQRYRLIDPKDSAKHGPFTRFEHEQPNALWQMDFKGHFALSQGRCHPLTVLDDHSRFSLCLQACGNEQSATVQSHLTETFRRYGLPTRIGVDNGPPWGDRANSPYTPLTVWLIRLGIRVTHSRPYHPQTLGKAERFHRSLKLELLGSQVFQDLVQAQHRFDQWRHCYNFERPHEAVDMKPPASRYRASALSFPEQLPPIEYADTTHVRKVQYFGELSYKGRPLRVSKAFRGYPVAVRPHASQDGLIEVFFCHQKIATFDLTAPQ